MTAERAPEAVMQGWENVTHPVRSIYAVPIY
jgi:hypothetical protein